MSEPQKMYRGWFSFLGLSIYSPDSPVSCGCACMELSPCGQYLYLQRRSMDDRRWETTREDINEYWQPTEALALAKMAPRLRRIGERLIRQADELEQAAEQERHDRPALAAEADA